MASGHRSRGLYFDKKKFKKYLIRNCQKTRRKTIDNKSVERDTHKVGIPKSSYAVNYMRVQQHVQPPARCKYPTIIHTRTIENSAYNNIISDVQSFDLASCHRRVTLGYDEKCTIYTCRVPPPPFPIVAPRSPAALVLRFSPR